MYFHFLPPELLLNQPIGLCYQDNLKIGTKPWPVPMLIQICVVIGHNGFTNHVCGSLTHWGRVTHICVSKLTIIGSDNGLSPGRRQAIIWTNAGILLIGPSGTNFSEILIKIHTFSFKKMWLKVSTAKWRPSYLGLNVLSSSTKKSAKTSVAVGSHICV